MPTCVIDNLGTLETTTDTVEDCTGFILQSTTEYLNSQTFDSIFGTPDLDTMLFLFRGGFGTVLLTWMVSWFYGAVLEWFNDNNPY